jgi:hypothetical protein
MVRYQIRTPESGSIGHLVDALQVKVWDAITTRPCLKAGNAERERLAEKIHYLMILHTKAYDLCGLSGVCTDPAVAALSGQVEASNRDHIYHLLVPMNIELFQHRLAEESVECVRQAFPPEAQRAVFSAVLSAIRDVFARYLFENPLCGAADLCADAKEVNAWNSEPTEK